MDSKTHPYAKLCQLLQGRGVPDIEQAFMEMELEPVLVPMREILHPGYMHYLVELMDGEATPEQAEALLDETARKVSDLLDGIGYYQRKPVDKVVRTKQVKEMASAIRALVSNPSEYPLDAIPGKKIFKKAEQFLANGIDLHPENRVAFVVASHLQVLENPLGLIEDWKLGPMMNNTFKGLDIDVGRCALLTRGTRMYLSIGDWYQKYARLTISDLITKLFTDDEVRRFIQVNDYDDTEWFNEELLRELEWWLVASAYYHAVSTPAKNAVSAHEALIGSYEVAQKVREARMKAEYKYEKLLAYFDDEEAKD